MGMYDEVHMTCPSCKNKIRLQSRANECLFDVYDLQNAPENILKSLEGRTHFCQSCTLGFEIAINYKPIGVVVIKDC